MGLQDQMNDLAKTAVRYGQSFNVELDYSKESLVAVEKILYYYSQDMQNCDVEEQPTENQLWSMATIWGAYIGEVIRREVGPDFIWTDKEEFGNKTPHVQSTRTDVGTFPIDKVYKRLVNGAEDNIVTYFNVGMEYLTGKSDWPSGHVLHIKVDGWNK